MSQGRMLCDKLAKPQLRTTADDLQPSSAKITPFPIQKSLGRNTAPPTLPFIQLQLGLIANKAPLSFLTIPLGLEPVAAAQS